MLAFLGNIVDPVALCAMILGIFLVAWMQNGSAAIWSAFAALGVLVRANPAQDRDIARAAMRQVEEVAEIRGLACTDRVRANSAFLGEAVNRLANCKRVEQFEIWAGEALADREERHRAVQAVWNSMADAAPALGMAGTVLGLVRMFMHMDDPAAIGAPMAMALLVTLYGIVIANVVAGPIAARLTALSAQELAWQKELVERMLAVARRENAPLRRASMREVGAA